MLATYCGFTFSFCSSRELLSLILTLSGDHTFLFPFYISLPQWSNLGYYVNDFTDTLLNYSGISGSTINENRLQHLSWSEKNDV